MGSTMLPQAKRRSCAAPRKSCDYYTIPESNGGLLHRRRPPVFYPCRRSLPAAAGARAALLLEAIRAVHRLVTTRHERHLGLLATRCAGSGVHLARATAAVAAATA